LAEEKIAAVKIEGLAHRRIADEIFLIAVTDADGETSEVLEIEIK
jgi:hypothetical protein